jgi:hypothetical protein
MAWSPQKINTKNRYTETESGTRKEYAEKLAFHNFHALDTSHPSAHPNLVESAVNSVRTPMPRWYCQKMVLPNGTCPEAFLSEAA